MTTEANDSQLLADAAQTTFKLNGQFLVFSDELAVPAGMTSAWWWVLGTIVAEPLPVSAIAREMCLTRQSVQRVADIVVEKGLAEYRDNPAHRRSKLLAVTDEGRAAMKRTGPHQRKLAGQLATAMGPADLAAAVDAMHRLSSALEKVAVERA